MKSSLAFLGGAACLAIGVLIGRGRSPTPLPPAGSVWFYAGSPAGDAGRTVQAMYDITDQLVSLHNRLENLEKLWPASKGLVSSGQSSTGLFGQTTDGEACDAIVIWIEDSVEPESWKDNGGTEGSIRSFAGYLFVETSLANQEKIRVLLETIRQ